MRLAYVTDQILPRRATDTFQLISMASALGRVGADVTVVAPARRGRPPADPAEIADYYGVEASFRVEAVRSIYPLFFRGLEKVAHAFAMLKSDAVRRGDVLYTRNLPIVTCALTAGRIPVVYETYRPWPEWNPSSKFFFDWVGGRENFLGAILHSNHARDSYARTRIDVSRLLTAYNGFDLRSMEPRLSKEEARAAVGLPADVPVAVYVGSVSIAKGIGEILSIARLMPDVRFILVGSEGKGTIEEEANGLPNVTIVGWRPLAEAAPFLQAADVLVIPPSSRPLREVGNTVLPIKTFMYLAAGRAILAPATPDVSEVLTDGVNAVLVQPDDAAQAARRLRELLENPHYMEKLGRAAANHASGFTWEKRAQKVLAFMEERLHDYRPKDHREL